jgi:hypothetical protein
VPKKALGQIEVEVAEPHQLMDPGVQKLNAAAATYAQGVVDQACKKRNDVSAEDIDTAVAILDLEGAGGRSKPRFNPLRAGLKIVSVLAAALTGVFGAFLPTTDKFVVGAIGTPLMALLTIALMAWEASIPERS